MGRIKVLQLVEDFGTMGGAEKLVYDLVTHLNPDEFESSVALVTEGKHNLDYWSTKAKLVFLPRRRRLSLDVLIALVKIIRDNCIDITHSHLTRMNTYNWLASRWCRKVSIGTIHGIMKDEVSFSARVYTKFAAKFNTRTVAVSENLRREFISTYGIESSKVVTIWNGFDASRIEKKPSLQVVNSFRFQYNCPPSVPVIVAIGHVREVKGYIYLLEAVHKIRKFVPDVRLLVAGKGTQKEELSLFRKLNEMSLESSVSFLGEYNDIATLFEIADLYVSSSLHEGFSLTTVEAMASGLPVVVTDCGGPAEIVENGKNGIIVPVADSQALANAIMKILSDKNLAEEFAENGKKRAYDNFSMKSFIEKHEQLYRELIK